jgi:hypothetical protein
MLPRLVLLVILLIGAYFLFRRLRRLGWSQRLRRIVVVIGVGAMLLLLIVRGGAEIALPLLTILTPFLLRWLNAPLPSPSSVVSSGVGGQSEITTHFLRMTLDHVTGIMSGVVQAGCFAGRLLPDLTSQELLVLWRECQVDQESVAVLEAYLDRQGDSEWREQFRRAETADSARTTSHDSTMSRAEAYEVLGLLPSANQEEIQVAYRRLMQRLHPDHGGSAYLAARLNQARQILW